MELVVQRDRRLAIKAACVGALGLGMPLTALARLSQSLNAPGFEADANRSKSVRIIGVGGAGCNIVRTLQANSVQAIYDGSVEFMGVDLGAQSRPSAGTSKGLATDGPQIRAISLAPYGAGGQVNAARVAALCHIDALNSAANGADTVILVAGLGGGAGSGVSPIIASLARKSGAVTIAAAVMPFDFEGVRNGVATTALRYLTRETDGAVCFSNQEVADALGDSALLDDIFTAQDQRVGACISDFLAKMSR